jgi:fructose-1-phosphate kinase PfkB-like protein
MKGVTILGLNAVWQKVLSLNELGPGSVHRTEAPSHFFSGKGGNVAVAMERLGSPDIELIQALGGQPGEWIIEDMKRFEITPKVTWIRGNTRVCTTLTEADGRTTELIEPSPEMTKVEWDELAQLVAGNLQEKGDVLICGSFPEGDPGALLQVLSQRVQGVVLWVDGLREDILALKPDVLKINQRELRSLVSSSGTVFEGCEEVSKKFLIPTLIITDEKGPVSLWSDGHRMEINVPPLEKVVNTTGAGDTFFGALVHARQTGLNWEEAIGRAVSWAGLRCGLTNVEDLPKLDK